MRNIHVLAAMVASISVLWVGNGSAASCGPIKHLDEARVYRPKFPELPERDRVSYPEADADIRCWVNRAGTPSNCRSTLNDPRGAALVTWVAKWRMIFSPSRSSCEARRREFIVHIRLRNGD
jgi:hypothetical protein